RRRFPSVRLRLREMAPARQIDEFRAGRLDVGFTRPIPATDEAWLRSEYLYRDSLLAVLPKGHQGSARAVVSVKQLADEPFVLFHRAGAGFEPATGYEPFPIRHHSRRAINNTS